VNALLAGMRSDGACGNSYRYLIMRKNGTSSAKDDIVPDFAPGLPKEMRFTYPKDSTIVLKKKEIRFDVVEAMEVA